MKIYKKAGVSAYAEIRPFSKNGITVVPGAEMPPDL
jgi:hypothetical protein